MMFEIYAKHTVKRKVVCDTPEKAVLFFRQNFPEYNVYAVGEGDNQMEVFNNCQCGNPILAPAGELPKDRCSECVENIGKITNLNEST